MHLAAPEEVAGEPAGLSRRQGLEEDRGRVVLPAAPGATRVEQLRSSHADDEQRRVAHPVGDVLDQVEKRRLGPVDVVEDDDERLLLRERLEQPAHGPERLLGRAAGAVPADDRGDPLGDDRGIRASDRRFDPGAHVLLPERLGDDLRDRTEGDSLAVRQAAAGEDARALADLGRSLREQARLADTGGAEDGEEVAGAALHRACERVLEESPLAAPPDHRRAETRRVRPSRVERQQPVAPAPAWPFPSAPAARAARREPRRGRAGRSSRRRGSRPARRRAWSRCATTTESPVTNVSPRVGSPATTSPVQTPIRISSRSPNDSSSSSFRTARRSRISSAARERPQRIVLVQDGSAEDGHHGVADELLDRAAVTLERGSHLVEVARHHAPHQLGVAHLAEARSSR